MGGAKEGEREGMVMWHSKLMRPVQWFSLTFFAVYSLVAVLFGSSLLHTATVVLLASALFLGVRNAYHTIIGRHILLMDSEVVQEGEVRRR